MAPQMRIQVTEVVIFAVYAVRHRVYKLLVHDHRHTDGRIGLSKV